MKPTKDFSTRLEAAKQWRSTMEPYIRDVYAFCAPDRTDDFNKTGRRGTIADTTVNHSIGEEACDDLAGDLVTYFCPREAKWFASTILTPIPEDLVEEAVELVGQREKDVDELIDASNLYDIIVQFNQEIAGPGTSGMWVSKSHLQQPIHCEVVPPAELFVTPGHLGILDRFREVSVHASTLPALFADEVQANIVNLSSREMTTKINKPGVRVTVCWGFYVDWTDPAYPQWKQEITIDDKSIMSDGPVILGPLNGSCPLLVGRFNPRVGRPWGRGCGLRAVADMRVLDQIENIVLLGLEDALKTTLVYADDGYMDFSNGGVVAGSAIPASRGFTREQVYELSKTTNMEVGFFTKEELERRIRSLFYQDGPRQRGDTPPTAAQWFDEARRVQKKLGKPAAPLFTEFYAPLIQRFEYLGAQVGALEPELILDGTSISIMPISPLQKAQNQDQVMIARSNLELGQMTFGPEAMAQFIDVPRTYSNIIRASGDTLTMIREEEPTNAATEPS